MKKVLIGFVLSFVFLSVSAYATDYYVDATNGLDSNMGTSPSQAWKTINEVNQRTFSPGDYILFKRGEVWRSEGWSERLVVPSSGSIGNPITFGSYGTGDKPKILGSIAKNSVSDWTNEGGNLWYAGFTSEVGNIIMDHENSYATMVLNKTDLDTQGEAWWDSANSRIYMYSTSNPAIYYNGWIECARRASIIQVNDKAHITIDGLDLRYTSRNAIYLYHSSTGDNLKVKNCNIKFCGNSISGDLNWGGAGVYAVNLTSLTFMNNTVDYVWHAVWHGDDEGGCVATITDNIVTHVEMGPNPSAFAFGGDTQILIDYTGSVIRGNDISGFRYKGISMSHSSNFIIEYNVIHDGYDEVSNAMMGISLGARTQRGHIVRYNHIYNVKGNSGSWAGGVGISTRNTGNAEIYYNVIHDCTKGATDGRLDQNVNDDNNNNAWYNNIFYNCDQYGMRVHVGVNAGDKKSITIQNNVLDGNTDDILVNDYVDVTGGWNCLINDASIGLGTESTYSGSTNDLYQTNPLFTDPSNNIFTLQYNSPCIDNGTYVGLTQDFEGNPVPQGSAPDIGAYEYAGEAPICEPDTYYVDATNGNDNNDGRCTNTAWKTISKVNSMSFSPGDNILFKRGEIWRERLAPPSSGSAGNPITFGDYGTGDNPIINGADLVTPWTDDGSNVWYADLTSEPRQVFFDNVRGNNQTSKADVDSDKDWFWEGNTLYVYSVGNPDTVYTNPGMEVSDSSRGQCISIHAKSYIDIRDLDLRNAYTHCLDMYNSDNINVYDNDISNSGKRGIYTSTSSYMDIYRNTFEWCGVELVTPEHGIYLGTNSSHVDVYENEVSYSWNSGIKCDSVSDVKVYRNYVHDNNQEYSYFGEIHIGSSAADLSNLEIYYNLIEIGDGYGIHSGYLYGHTKTNVSIYNNVIWDNNAGPAPKNYALRLENIDTLNIKNNAIKTAREYVMRYNNNSNVIRDYNCYHGWTHATRMGSIDGSWVTWSDVSSVETHSINQDPLFIDAANTDFHLQSSSPCIDAGTDVGLTQDFEGNSVPQGNSPDIGAYEYLSGEVLLGDLNNDGFVNIHDLTMVTTHFGLTETHPDWDETADVIQNGEIDIYDVVFVASRFT